MSAAEEFGGGSGGGAQGPGGVDACRDHGLEFEVAVRERERPAVGSVGDLDVAGGDQAVGMLDLLGIAGELGGDVVGEGPFGEPRPADWVDVGAARCERICERQ
ncbi:MAG: hypothetical protein QOC62_5428 [Mycobacterium sp.]|nr:hypothetical protein [Mycobacterium sp.]